MNTKSRMQLWPWLAVYAMVVLLLAGCSNKFNRDYTKLPKGSYNDKSYTVKSGDTLYFIAWISDSEVSDLARINKLRPPYRLEVGQKLQLSSSAASGRLTSTKRKSSSTVLAKSTPPPGASRCWRWPTNGQIISRYSTADGGNKGIDITAKRGQPIYASAKGRVVYVGNQLRGYGNLIMIKHGEDFITAYAHNDTMLVNNAQDVKAGQKIATMGSTGTDTVMLHFQIRYRATALDPLRYLPPQGASPKC
ncbi:putative lipoprotein [Yersinia intermedia]|uniref:Peptidoglycan DD-metalloendopeptidase family protein n=2 Tax=Yersinia intermedia TaxID=631 RepID=A0ABX6FBQ6_YERIN|nr:peptidoglycan DD-metalloendopeptidase family protein [Yersinia intermedia]QGR71182.1 peptidoglycan DD-metalloendopeptidase family protein [Yersinia intermedia]CRY75474.1 putative lipoprotein [Yersinia intermedia]VDZ55521.1 putative lipoprotein [Yersinia intermedia]